MQPKLTVTAPASPDRVFAYPAVPRNLITANRLGPVVSQSTDPSEGAGSWAVMKFDQLRVRVEYTTFDRPTRIGAVVEYSGVGSGGRREGVEFGLTALPGGGTEIVLATDADAPAIPVLGRLLAPLAVRGLRKRLAAIQD